MRGFLDTYGSEKAERCLAEFVAQVRAATPEALGRLNPGLLGEEITALGRRVQAAGAELARRRTEVEAAGAALGDYLRAAQELKGEDEAGAAALLADLGQAVAAQEAEEAALSRAEAWLADLEGAWRALSEAFAVAEAPAAGKPPERSGMMRALSQVSAAVDSMTAAAQVARQEAEAALREAGPLGLARLNAPPALTGALGRVRSGRKGAPAARPRGMTGGDEPARRGRETGQ